jgi:hypothetical protein
MKKKPKKANKIATFINESNINFLLTQSTWICNKMIGLLQSNPTFTSLRKIKNNLQQEKFINSSCSETIPRLIGLKIQRR